MRAKDFCNCDHANLLVDAIGAAMAMIEEANKGLYGSVEVRDHIGDAYNVLEEAWNHHCKLQDLYEEECT